MKKILALFTAVLMAFVLTSCSQDNSPKTSSLPNAEILRDNGFIKCAKETFLEIGIEVSPEDFQIIRDETVSGVRSIDANTTYDEIQMQFSCFTTEDRWKPVSISDVKTKKYYWLDSSVESYGNVYDWKTGEIIKENTEEFPDDISSDARSEAIDTVLVMEYDEKNSCQITLSVSLLEDGGNKTVGTCNFDGTDSDTETLRALAFTKYCMQNASVFSDGNLSMLFYSGEDDGYAKYEHGELALYEFPDAWNSSYVSDDEIANELQNIIDNIKAMDS